MPRGFKVPCGKWLIPTVGSLLCVLLLKGISKATGFRFLAWTLLGQVIYFLHGFWHSRAGLFATNRSTTSMAELPVNLEDNLGADPPNEFEMDLASVYAGDQAQTTNHPDIDKFHSSYFTGIIEWLHGEKHFTESIVLTDVDMYISSSNKSSIE
ncbi:unnamed protein product [Rotaria magnacalcarata]|nr:unnamed protein product [Rotaria magnacalcarata]CAF4006047.1 unnamed protein product [Rotaria magnacalcarata]